MNKDTENSKPEVKAGEFAQKKGEVVLRDHTFDGIQEYDQKMPNWWLTILWLSIGFFFVYYLIYYTFELLPTSQSDMDARVEKIEQQRAAALKATLDKLDNSTLVSWSEDSSIVAKGKTVYGESCTACHGQDLKAAGLPGRPLTDGVWEHGGEPMQVFNIINDGTPKGHPGFKSAMMIPWGPQLGPEKVAFVTAYIMSQNKEEFAKFKK